MIAQRFSAEDIQAARCDAAHLARDIIEALEERSGLSRDAFLMALSNTLHLPPMVMSELDACTPVFDIVSYEEACKRECVSVRDPAGQLCLIVGNPFEPEIFVWLSSLDALQAQTYLAHRSDVLAFLQKQSANMAAVHKSLLNMELTDSISSGEITLSSIASQNSPVVKLVYSTLYDALRAQASDVHLERTSTGLTVKQRLDGVLVEVAHFSESGFAEQVVSRVKVLANLDIAEQRVPQDGRFQVMMFGREVDFRVSIMPSIHGEDAVIRVLDRNTRGDTQQGIGLDKLGFDADTLGKLRKLARDPYGMLLVTGPTGSGKTTTLYETLLEINSGREKIITIEDPIEYHLPGVLQIPVNEKKGLTFARGLRSILRHDPDKVMVGEIRDAETAQIAVQAALTGHLVFTTVHANNVFDVIGRFINMEVEPRSFVSALNGILAQRLVRLNCTYCSAPHRPDEGVIMESGLHPDDLFDYDFHSGKGCGHCRGVGYRGRKAIAEVLQLNDELREIITSNQPLRLLKEAARKTGLRSLREAALALVRHGETTLQEINRVTFAA